MKYRDRAQILYYLLKLLSIQSVNKTRLMYVAYLSYSQLKEYLRLMVDKDLIRELPTRKFILTEKGLRLYHLLAEVGDILDYDKSTASTTMLEIIQNSRKITE